jgi:hypothetical protein
LRGGLWNCLTLFRFYKFVNSHFPVLSPTDIPTPAESATHLLAAIYLVAEQFTDFDEYLCIQLVYKSTPLQDLFDIAWRIISNSMDRPTLSIIQSCLILLLKPPLDPLSLDRSSKWSLMGAVTHMAQTLGLHLNPEGWRIPGHEISLRRQLSWLIFAMDKSFALSFGRPSNLTEDNWSITQIHNRGRELSYFEGLEDTYCVQFSKLTTTLDRVLRKLL